MHFLASLIILVQEWEAIYYLKCIYLSILIRISYERIWFIIRKTHKPWSNHTVIVHKTFVSLIVCTGWKNIYYGKRIKNLFSFSIVLHLSPQCWRMSCNPFFSCALDMFSRNFDVGFPKIHHMAFDFILVIWLLYCFISMYKNMLSHCVFSVPESFQMHKIIRTWFKR